MQPFVTEKLSAGNQCDFESPLTFVRRGLKFFLNLLFIGTLLFLSSGIISAQSPAFEDRPIANLDVAFSGNDADQSAADQFRVVIRGALGDTYSAVKIRAALAALYRTDRIAYAQVEAAPNGTQGINVRFVIRRKTVARRVSVEVGSAVGDKITEDELLYRLNLLESGTAFTEQVLRNNTDLIQDYLRERGFFNAEVTFRQQPLASDTQVAVIFSVTPNEQAKVSDFNLDIKGFKTAEVQKKLKLQAGEYFTREKLNADVEKIRAALRDEQFVAPQLNEPRVVYDRSTNTVGITLSGAVGPTVKVSVEAEKEKVSEGTQTRLLPIKREGTLDYSAIIEGERRLETYFQEEGYFFADVKSVCSVKPDFAENDASYTANETEQLCASLSGADLTDRVVEVKYQTDLNRRLKLTEIRLEGTDQLPIEEVKPVLASKEASIIGIIPFLGYGRGYTSAELLKRDQATIRSLLIELGYRRATVGVRQGVALNGEDLIITFIVNEGIPTVIDDVQITGNKAFSEDLLKTKLPTLAGRNLSRARARNGVRALAEFYSNEGYYNARVNYAIEEQPDTTNQTEDHVKIIYTVENEGRKVLVNRILISGNEDTKRGAIEETINLRPGAPLRSTDIFASEQSLYATDAFRRVDVKVQPAGEDAQGNALSDIAVNVEEQKPRLLTYGGGYSTDSGVFGLFDIRHSNLFGRLQQGGIRVRASRLQQLVQIDYVQPRFLNDGKTKDGVIRFSPLTFTAAYQRDTTVTRFFRSSLDQGTFGIVQRLDADGNPIDEFGRDSGDPTITRLSFAAESSRTISRRDRSIVFFRYRFESVRLTNVESLLVRDLLRPDARIRTSGFGANFVRDTRENCSRKFSVLEIIQNGDQGDPCRYSPTDPTKGDYLTAEYNVSLPFLGANIGFHKLQASYYRFFTVRQLRNTTFAGRGVLGLASVFTQRQGFNSSQADLNNLLPISERFFAGGSTTLRGFEYEAAGPRVVIVAAGSFFAIGTAIRFISVLFPSRSAATLSPLSISKRVCRSIIFFASCRFTTAAMFSAASAIFSIRRTFRQTTFFAAICEPSGRIPSVWACVLKRRSAANFRLITVIC